MPIGRRQYEPALGFPGQRASYQDYTHGHNTQDECINNMATRIPFGRFVTKDASPAAIATGLPGLLALPTSAAASPVIGLAPHQGWWEADCAGVGGIPAKQAMFYAYKGIYFVETVSAVTRTGTGIFVYNNPAIPANLGKITTVAADGVALPAGQYRVLDAAAANGLVRIELDLPSTLLV